MLKEIANRLNGSQYSSRQIPENIIKMAKENKIVIVYGASDDLIELRGMIDAEGDCFDGGVCYFNQREQCEMMSADFSVEAVWHDRTDPCWTYRVSYPHETFLIWEDDVPYCEGIVFYLKDAIAAEKIVDLNSEE